MRLTMAGLMPAIVIFAKSDRRGAAVHDSYDLPCTRIGTSITEGNNVRIGRLVTITLALVVLITGMPLPVGAGQPRQWHAPP